jgi:hypothetical protein
MTTPKKLSICGHYCGVGQHGIHGLNLTALDAGNNANIKDVSFMTNLKVLFAYGSCGIDKAGINGLNIGILHANDNIKHL